MVQSIWTRVWVGILVLQLSVGSAVWRAPAAFAGSDEHSGQGDENRAAEELDPDHSRPPANESSLYPSPEEFDKNFETSMQALHETLEGKRIRHPLDPWRVLDQIGFPIEDPLKTESGKFQFQVGPVVRDKDGQIEFRPGTVLWTEGDSRAISQSYKGEEWSVRILFQGRTVIEFRMPIVSAALVDDRYFVFTEPGRYFKADHAQEVSFIDLKKYRYLLGRAEAVPIFKVNRESVRNASRLNIDNGKLYAGYAPIPTEALEIYSQIEETMYNNSVNLADPSFYERAVDNISDLALYGEKMIATAGESLESETETAEILGQQIQQMIKARTADLQRQADAQKALDDQRKAEKKLKEEARRKAAKVSTDLPENPSFVGRMWSRFSEWVDDKSLAVSNAVLVTSGLLPAATSKAHLDLTTPALPGPPVPPPVVEVQRKILSRLGAVERSQQKFLTRANLLLAKMSLPQPLGPSKLREALAFVAMGSRHETSHYLSALRLLLTPDGLLEVAKHPYAKMGAAAVTGATLAVLYPEQAAQFVYQGLEVGKTAFDLFSHRASQTAALGGDAFTRTFAWVGEPSMIYDTFIKDGRRSKTLIGLTAISAAIYTVLGVPHVLANTLKLAKDFRRTGVWSRFFDRILEGSFEERWSALSALKEEFIQRQNKEQQEYLKVLSGAEAAKDKQKKNKNKELEFTAEQTAAVKLLVEALKRRDRSYILRLVTAIRESSYYQRFVKSVGAVGKGVYYAVRPAQRQLDEIEEIKAETEAVPHADRQIATFGGALAHFFVSLASFTNSGIWYTNIWNGYFRLRSFIWSPSQLVTFLLFPRFSKVIEQSDSESPRLPTQYNGGTRNAASHWASKFLDSSASLEAIEAWEKKILPFEDAIRNASVRSAFRALARHLSSSSELTKLYGKSGIHQLNEESVRTLSAKNRAFFRLYFDRVFEESMQRFVNRLLRPVDESLQAQIDSMDWDVESLDAIKRHTLGRLEAVDLSADDAPEKLQKEMQSFVGQVAQDLKLDEDIKAKVDRRFAMLASMPEQAKYAMFRKMDPNLNTQMGRMSAVEKQLANPKAMARAVKGMVASNLVDKPMELAFAFAFLSGMTDPLMKPLHDEMFSDNSWFYLSRLEFWNYFVIGTLTGVLGDIWVKLQQDEKNEGSFDEVPQGEDAKLSYQEWYLKKFNDPENTVWKNQKHFFKIIIPNIKAALTLFVVSGLASLGRFDLDMYLTSYFASFFIWDSGVSYKIEQGYELSTGWYAKDIPEELRSHPLIQEYLAKRTGKARIWFNAFYKVYENVWGYFIGAFKAMGTPTVGNRAFTRIVSPQGFTPTEWISEGARAVQGSDAPAAAKALAAGCDHLLTNNYRGLKDPSSGEHVPGHEPEPQDPNQK